MSEGLCFKTFKLVCSKLLRKRLKAETNIGNFSGINPLQPGVAFLYPLKTSENLWVF